MSGVALDVSGLTDAVLEAAASRGLLRRAARDVEAGLVRPQPPEGGTAVLLADGETVRLRPGGLSAAACTCPAPGVCRHVLAAVLALRAAPPAQRAGTPPPAPAGDALDEIAELPASALAKAFGRAALGRAEALLADAAPGGDVAVEAAGPACTVSIPGQPVVHYVAGAGPGGMVSKSGDPKTLHAAALLAVRRLRAGQAAAPAPAPDAPAAPGKAEVAFLDKVAEMLRDAARTALVSAPAALEDRLLDLAVSLRADAAPNLAGALRSVAGDMAQRRARSAGFASWDALAAIARAYTLAEALRRHGSDLQLRGSLRGAFEPCGPLDLLGCGATVWRTEGGARGATAYFLAPDGGQPYSVTLARAGGQDLAFAPKEAARSEMLWGETLQVLGQAAFRLPDAQADAGNRLAPRVGARAAVSPVPWAEAAHNGGLVVEEWAALETQLHAAFAPTLRRRDKACPVLLQVSALAPPAFDAMGQAATLPVQDRAGAWLELRIEADDDMDTQLAALASLPSAGAGAVLSVLARAEGGGVVLSPLGYCAPGGRLQHLAFASRPAAATSGWMKRLRQGLAAAWPAGRGPCRFERLSPPPGATSGVLDAAADEALALAELGGRMEDAELLQRLGSLARQLEAGGAPVLARLLSRLSAAAPGDRPHHLLAFVHALACWRQFNPRLPLLRPA